MNQRRDEFEDITMGWGADNRADLEARVALAKEWLRNNGVGKDEQMACRVIPTAGAELKVLRAMEARLVAYQIAAGEHAKA